MRMPASHFCVKATEYLEEPDLLSSWAPAPSALAGHDDSQSDRPGFSSGLGRVFMFLYQKQCYASTRGYERCGCVTTNDHNSAVT